MKIRTISKTVGELPNGISFEFPIMPENWLREEVTVVELANGNYGVAYLCHDSDCHHPLDDCDGQGNIWHHPRGRYGKSDGYFIALGLDRNGEPMVDEDKLQQRWFDTIMALPLSAFECGENWQYQDNVQLRSDLANESIVGDFSLLQNCASAWAHHDFTDDQMARLVEQVEENLDWSYGRTERECFVGPNPYAILLDVYDHGQRSYSLSGRGMQDLWDTSRGEAVWIADTHCKEEIDRRAKVYAFGSVEEVRRAGKVRYHATFNAYSDENVPSVTVSIGIFENWHEAFDELQRYAAHRSPANADQKAQGLYRAKYEVARSCVAEFDMWQRGECFGVISFEVDQHGNQVGDEDACWGFIGQEYAEQERDGRFAGQEAKDVA